MKIRSKIAYAVVDKIKPKIDVLDIFTHKDVSFHKKTEKLIRVIISEYDGNRTSQHRTTKTKKKAK